jgi:hypothetical protein
MKFVIIAILFIVVGMWLKSRASPGGSHKSPRVDLKKKLQEKKRSSATSIHNPYHAVSIHQDARACPSALDMGNRRFLAADAPIIPLAECTSPHCDCKYAHHKDRRRDDGDRRTIGSGLHLQSDREERRRGLGRRVDDLDNYALT